MKVGRQDPEHPGSSQRIIMTNRCLTDPSWATLVSLPTDGMQHLCPHHYTNRGEFFVYKSPIRSILTCTDLSADPHVTPTTSDSKFSQTWAYKLLVITPGNCHCTVTPHSQYWTHSRLHSPTDTQMFC